MDASQERFPRRDADGRVLHLPDLLGLTAASLVLCFLVILGFDVLGSLAGWGEFGSGSGWLALILPAWLFLIDELRAWRAVRARLLVVISGALVGIAAGMLVAGVTPGPPLVTSGVGAAVASLAYAVYWFHGIRWMARREESVR